MIKLKEKYHSCVEEEETQEPETDPTENDPDKP